jgi:hypothetical protein
LLCSLLKYEGAFDPFPSLLSAPKIVVQFAAYSIHNRRKSSPEHNLHNGGQKGKTPSASSAKKKGKERERERGKRKKEGKRTKGGK